MRMLRMMRLDEIRNEYIRGSIGVCDNNGQKIEENRLKRTHYKGNQTNCFCNKIKTN